MSTNIQKNQITEGIIWRQLLLFFFPILLGTFFQQLYNTIDSVIVGQFVGKEALAAVGGSSAQIVAFVVGFFTGLSSGASVTIAQFFGAKDSRSANKGLHTAPLPRCREKPPRIFLSCGTGRSRDCGRSWRPS